MATFQLVRVKFSQRGETYSAQADCEESVVASQCGAEIARHMRALDERLWAVLGCSAGQ